MAETGSRVVRIALAAAAAALAGGCQAQHPPPARSGSASALVLRSSTHCGAEDEGTTARWIPTEGALHAALIATGGFGENAPPKIDFEREGVVLVSMGQRRTGGYALTLADPKVAIANGIATMVVAFEEPPRGAMVTQALTSPCLLVRVPKAGIRELRVVDTSGTVRATVAVPFHAERRPVPPERRYRGSPDSSHATAK